MVSTTPIMFPRTKAARRFNVLTKASEIQKRGAIHKRKTVWFPLHPVVSVHEPVPVPVPVPVDEDTTTNRPATTTHEVFGSKARQGTRESHTASMF
jgi:hypothetical protein